MRKRSGQVHSRESSATLQLTVSLLYPDTSFVCINSSSRVSLYIMMSGSKEKENQQGRGHRKRSADGAAHCTGISHLAGIPGV